MLIDSKQNMLATAHQEIVSPQQAFDAELLITIDNTNLGFLLQSLTRKSRAS